MQASRLQWAKRMQLTVVRCCEEVQIWRTAGIPARFAAASQRVDHAV